MFLTWELCELFLSAFSNITQLSSILFFFSEWAPFIEPVISSGDPFYKATPFIAGVSSAAGLVVLIIIVVILVLSCRNKMPKKTKVNTSIHSLSSS